MADIWEDFTNKLKSGAKGVRFDPGAGKYGGVNTEGLRLARGLPTTSPVAPVIPTATTPQVISGGRIPAGMAQPGVTGGGGGAPKVPLTALAGAGAAGAGLLGVGALPVATSVLGTGLAAYGVTRQLIKDIPGAEKAIEGIGGAIHGPVVDTSNAPPVPDLNVMGATVPGGGQAPPAQIDTAAQTKGGATNPALLSVVKPAYTPGSVVEKLAEVQTPLGTPSKTDTPIDQSQFGGGGKGINYSLDAAGNVVAEAPTAKVNPHDQDFKDTLDKIDLLNQSFIPAKSGYISDTIAENFDLVTRIKGLKEKAALLQPMTTEGQGIPRAALVANAEKRLAPEQTAELEARTNLYNMKANEASKPELKNQEAALKTDEKISKMTETMVQNDPTMDPEKARDLAKRTHKMPEVPGGRRKVQNKSGQEGIEVPYVDGTVKIIDPVTGKTFMESWLGNQGVPVSKKK